MTVPNPRHDPHGDWVITLPSRERTVRLIMPPPPQMSQVTGAVPG
jgi:hypothetical protein